ncbi:MAG: DUF2087 domain-containing protein [Microlunatus sp.]|nr:DUF2087 domain-containing protein [Microlunatus sp.]
MTTPSLVERSRAARLVHELCRPASARVLGQLSGRPGSTAPAAATQQRTGLSIKEFWTTVRRLESVGVLRRTAGGLLVDHDQLDQVAGSWVADSPLNLIMIDRPRLAPFIAWGRVARMPTEAAVINELYDALARLFQPGETLAEAEVNARIAVVHDDPAEVRRALVDRGLLLRAPGSADYQCPDEPG